VPQHICALSRNVLLYFPLCDDRMKHGHNSGNQERKQAAKKEQEADGEQEEVLVQVAGGIDVLDAERLDDDTSNAHKKQHGTDKNGV